MQSLKGESATEPQAKVVGKNYVDVNTNIKSTSKTVGGVATTVYAYDVSRYTIQEYIAKISDESATATKAVAELSDLVLTKE